MPLIFAVERILLLFLWEFSKKPGYFRRSGAIYAERSLARRAAAIASCAAFWAPPMATRFPQGG
jgi:hypothetical protein